ncbi:hypothetical protein K438DRAFT_697348 [Mycena galopus ATCC 62051]|nr:hypothetical protein K438DRAFT_697348 [Mycena galopus ATCC 62051]
MSVPSSQSAAREANPQLQSSFFRLPPELLRLIFMDALVECNDPWRPYSGDEVRYYGFKYAGKITISLLLTCRRIYDEARLLAAEVNVHTFWQGDAPPGQLVSNHIAYFASMPNEQLRRVRHARFLVDVNWLKRPNSLVSWPEELALRKLTITVRHTWLRQDGDWSDLDEVGPLSPTDPDQVVGRVDKQYFYPPRASDRAGEPPGGKFEGPDFAGTPLEIPFGERWLSGLRRGAE